MSLAFGFSKIELSKNKCVLGNQTGNVSVIREENKDTNKTNSSNKNHRNHGNYRKYFDLHLLS